jgi:hypothetical protein
MQNNANTHIDFDYSLTPLSYTQLSRHQFVVHAHGREFNFTSQQDAERFIAGIPLIV